MWSQKVLKAPAPVPVASDESFLARIRRAITRVDGKLERLAAVSALAFAIGHFIGIHTAQFFCPIFMII